MNDLNSVDLDFGGRRYILSGANRDLWQAMRVSSSRGAVFVRREDGKVLAAALGARADNERVEASKTLVKGLWAQYPELGPYPFIDTLSRFEFARSFHAGYRDHVCHQLKVYLLGIAILDACKDLRHHVCEIVDEKDLDLAWLVTAVFHDVGYVIENESAAPGSEAWKRTRDEYQGTMAAPLSKGLIQGLTSPIEKSVCSKCGIAPRTLGEFTDIDDPEMAARFAREADRAGLGRPDPKSPIIWRYYEYAQKYAPNHKRGSFRDHGVASALLLMRHWTNLDEYINDWHEKAEQIQPSVQVSLEGLSRLQEKRARLAHAIQRAAGAISLHNISPQLWRELYDDAGAASVGLDFMSFRIRLGRSTNGDDANGLAFLLALTDTLQDWDRPTFTDEPNPAALHGDDLSIRPDPTSGKVLVFLKSDFDEFKAPEKAARSRYSEMRKVMKEYLDPEEIDRLVEWNHHIIADRELEVPSTVDDARRVLHRGGHLDDVVDAAMVLDCPQYHEVERIRRAVIVNGTLDIRHLYSSDMGALRWLDLCNDHTYAPYADSIDLLSSRGKEILESCGTDFIRSSPDYISLGPGNGRKDRLLLDSLLRMQNDRQPRLYYYPFDISHTLLSYAINRVADLRLPIRIKAIQGDFEQLLCLLPVFDWRREPNLFLLLGNTFGNFLNESEFIRRLASAMSCDDVAIIEVRLRGASDPSNPGGRTDLRMVFNFSPLEFLGIRLDEGKLRYREAENNLSHVPGTATTVCEYIDYPYGGKPDWRTRLAVIHHYDPDQLKSFLEHKGLTVKATFTGRSTGVFVMTKTTG